MEKMTFSNRLKMTSLQNLSLVESNENGFSNSEEMTSRNSQLPNSPFEGGRGM
jgi:hypothetical protein